MILKFEDFVNEGKKTIIKKIRGNNISPVDLTHIVVRFINDYFNINLEIPSGQGAINSNGIEFYPQYSAYYMSDDNWYSYGDLIMDKDLYDSKLVTKMLQDIKKETK